jgi:hypothetical protein
MGTKARQHGAVGIGVAALLSIGLAASAGAAGSTAGDAEAQALVKTAMEQDYLAMAFDKAEQKLARAAAICQKRGCSPAREAEVHEYLAVVISGAKHDRDATLEELRKMLRLEPERTIDKAFASATLKDLLDVAKEDVAKEREEQKKRAAEDLDKKLHEPPPVGSIEDKPWPEQMAGTPVPVFVKLPAPPKGVEPERVQVTRVVVEYQGPAGSGKAELKPVKDGYGGHVPCDGVKAVGELKYAVTAYNKYDNPVAKMQTESRIPLKTAIASALPHLPDELPPESCDGSSKKAGCYDDTDCGPEKKCVEGTCKAKKKPPVAVPKKGGCAGCATSSNGTPRAALFLLAAGLIVAALRRTTSRARACACAPRPS